MVTAALAVSRDHGITGQRMTGKRIFLTGATGTAGRATLTALRAAGHDVVCFARGPADLDCEVRIGDPSSEASLARDGFCGEHFDAVISCTASRSGAPKDAWVVDYGVNAVLLSAALGAGVGHFILLSAICVQKPKLEFQHAKLAFEEELKNADLTYSIVRPTAFFKSLSGQVDRVRSGKPFLVFGNGQLTACKPISDGDLGAFIAGCVDNPDRANAVLPIGGPGPAISPMDQAEALFGLLDKPVQVKRVPVAMMTVIGGALRVLGLLSSKFADKAELARIGRYYATESMLLWDAEKGAYDADATPETGSDTLFEFYKTLIEEDRSVALGDHSVF